MKKSVAMMIAALIMVLGACGSQESNAFDSAVQKGFNAVRSGNYDKAESSFKKALKEKKGDKQAAALVTYTLVLKTAQEALNQGNFDDAISSAGIVIKQDKDSDAVLAKAQVIRKAALEAKQKQAGQSASEQARVSSSKTAENAESTASQATSSKSADSTAGGAVSSGSNSSGNDSSAAGQNTENSQSAASRQSSSSQTSKSDTVQGSKSQSGSSKSNTGTASRQVTEQEAEAAVAKAAGYSLQDVYVDTTDNGIYYSIELRENHKATGNADPLTAPAIGFFRYYKDSGRITQLDIPSDEYKDIK